MLPTQSFGETIQATISLTPVAIPVPEGFTDTSNTTPDLHKLMLNFVPSTNRSLAMFLLNDDVKALMQGIDPGIERYIMLQSFNELEDEDISDADFEEISQEMRNSVDTMYDQLKDELQSEINTMEQGFNDITDLKMDFELNNVIVLPKRIDIPGQFTHTSLISNKIVVEEEVFDQVMVLCSTILHIKDKFLYLFVYDTYKDQENINWAENTTEALVKSLLTANPD